MIVKTEDNIDLRMHDHDKWEVLSPVTFVIVDDGPNALVTVGAGFITDGASVPSILHWCMPSWHKRYGFAALLHDFLYVHQDRAQEVAAVFGFKDARKAADDIFFSMIRGWRRYPMWIAVRLFGGVVWRK